MKGDEVVRHTACEQGSRPRERQSPASLLSRAGDPFGPCRIALDFRA